MRGSRSAYLRQHAHNPLEWYPWGREALDRARRENKPIFLSIGYASCHWCHVMEREVFEKDDVAAFLNAHFISIKVDREERPDLDKVYMAAVQSMTGGGGWPMSVFLTPDLKPFWGGTYVPHDRFLKLARTLDRMFRKDRGRVAGIAARFAAGVSTAPELVAGGSVDPKVVRRAADRAWARFDRTWGGSRARMKFPTPLRWRLILDLFRKTGEKRYRQMARTTLDAIASGGIHDHVGGGFHRYTVEPTWLVPHFEKMLYDNAQLAMLFLEGFAALGKPRYAEVARDTLEFLLREMRDPSGGFYASFDADSGGKEGSFYVWTPGEIRTVVGAKDGAALAMLLGATDRGNFEGANVLTRRVSAEAVARKLRRPVAEIGALLDRALPVLRRHRAKRTAPNLDRKVVTSWNGLAIAALAKGARVLGEPKFREAAEKAAAFLWRVHRTAGQRLLRVSNGGVAEHEGVIDDYAFVSEGLLELFETTGDLEHLHRALKLIDFARSAFARKGGGFNFTRRGHSVPLGPQMDPFDSVRPSGLSSLLSAMLSASLVTGRTELREQVETSLRSFAPLAERAGLSMAGWHRVALRFLGPTYEVVIAGADDDARTRTLTGAVRRLAPVHAFVLQIPAAGPPPSVRKTLPTTEGKQALGGAPTAFVCEHRRCKLPTKDPNVLKRQILTGWSR